MPPVNVVNWLLAFSPIAVVLVLMVGLRWGGKEAGPAGWVVAVLVAWLWFGAGPEVLLVSQVRGLLLSLFVLYIIWTALLLYRVVDEAGALDVIGAGIGRLTADPTMQLLLIAWAFSSFVQGVAGFGVALAVVVPLLIGLGFNPLVAMVAVSIGHSWSITFGSMASSFQALIAASGLPGAELAGWSAFFLGVSCFGCGFCAMLAHDGWRSVRRGWPALLIMGTVMAAVQAGLAMTGLWNLAGFLAGLAGLGTAALVARLPRYQSRAIVPDVQARAGHARSMPALSLTWALAPYLLLVVVVGVAELWPWLNDVLNRIEIHVTLPEVETALGLITPGGVARTISVFGHAGALLTYVAVIFYALYQWQGLYTPGAGRRIVRQTVRAGMPATIGIASMVGFAVAMDHAGMTLVLAEGLARVAGETFPIMSPFIGLLGAFMTGSNTNSNVVFTPLQQQVATLLNLSVPVILGVQTTGGALGAMVAPARLIVGATTAGLAGREGELLKKLIPPCVILTALVGAIAWLVVRL
ncbi:MAG: L-lactate permease [Anaerolineae bacterium]|nr:L-lactate permease [Anaerolineae bacterium]